MLVGVKRVEGRKQTSPSPREGDACQAKRSTQGMHEIQRSNNTAQQPTRPAPPEHPPACEARVPLRKAKRGKPNLPFAPRRGGVPSEAQHAGDARNSTQQQHRTTTNPPSTTRASPCVRSTRPPSQSQEGERTNLPFAREGDACQAKRSTQGMHEIQRNNTITQRPTRPAPHVHPPACFARVPLRKAKRGPPPLRPAKGKRASKAQHAGDARNSTQQHHHTTTNPTSTARASPCVLRTRPPSQSEEGGDFRQT